MKNENKRTTKNHGPMQVPQKAKNFKKAIIRLFKELNKFKLLIVLSLILAVFGAVLSILAPDKLSDLTDEISKGLVINQKNIQKITSNVTSSFNSEKLMNILQLDFSYQNILAINKDNNITIDDKEKFNTFITKMETENKEEVFKNIALLPDEVLNKLVHDSEYNNTIVTVDQKLEIIRYLSGKNEKLTSSVANILFEEMVIDGVSISTVDQVDFVNSMKNVNSKTSADSLYKKLDGMPNSIKQVIEPKMNYEKIKTIVLILIIMYLLSSLFTYIEQLSMTNVSNKFAQLLRGNISKKINKLPLQYYDKTSTGDILSRVTNDVDTIAQSMNQSLATLVSSVVLFFGTIIMMFYTNWILALTAIIASLIGFVFMGTVLSKSQKYFSARQEQLGQLNGHIEEVYSGLSVVKAYNGEKEVTDKFDYYNQNVYKANQMSQFLSGLMMPMMAFIGNFGYVAVCIVGALLTMDGKISFGVIIAFITYVRLFTSPLSQIAQAMTSLQSTAAASERVFEFIDEKELSSQEHISKSLSNTQAKGNIEFKNVVFQYANKDYPTIKNFSAKVKTGQKVAIVGPTGAGKTTMVNLLMKFYEINSGDITIDGYSINELTRENIHNLFTMVLQDTWIFNGSIKDNIIYNRKNISDEDVEKVCKIVGLDHFVKTLPNGYNSLLSDNDSISAGQKQLITIARAMVESSPFLILDEATSNVDTRTEELVQKAMDKLTQGKTSFIIAHRLSTIKNADLILVMKDGNIIETGNHEQLIKQKGFYADLYNSQFEL